MVATKEELEELVKVLAEYKGRHTELITLYIPAGFDINSVGRQIETEKGTAKNIKSNATRKNVEDALEKIGRHLKLYRFTPKNGLAIFCGNVSKVDGQDDLQLWDIEPVEPLKIRLYRCDKNFVLEPLFDMLEERDIFGLVVMDRKEATIGTLFGKKIEVLKHLTSGVPSKVRAGGQSSQRFHRITEGLTKEFYKRIAEEVKEIFLNLEKLKGLIIGGPVPTKDEFLDGNYLLKPLALKVIGRIDVGNTDESGLKELVEKAQELISDQEIVKEKKILEKFFKVLGESRTLAAYKEEEVRKAISFGAVEMLLISKMFDKEKAKELRKMAEEIGSIIEVVSVETEEGIQFFNLGGIGAILRFRV